MPEPLLDVSDLTVDCPRRGPDLYHVDGADVRCLLYARREEAAVP